MSEGFFSSVLDKTDEQKEWEEEEQQQKGGVGMCKKKKEEGTQGMGYIGAAPEAAAAEVWVDRCSKDLAR